MGYGEQRACLFSSEKMLVDVDTYTEMGLTVSAKGEKEQYGGNSRKE